MNIKNVLYVFWIVNKSCKRQRGLALSVCNKKKASFQKINGIVSQSKARRGNTKSKWCSRSLIILEPILLVPFDLSKACRHERSCYYFWNFGIIWVALNVSIYLKLLFIFIGCDINERRTKHLKKWLDFGGMPHICTKQRLKD